MDNLTEAVTSDGRLDDCRIYARETLYKGMNGRFVERFYVSPQQSYIFKPVTHAGQEGRESWVYAHILPLIPDVYPKILAESRTNEETSWAIFEDLGKLNHAFEWEPILEVTQVMARWHAIPVERLPAQTPVTGHKPRIELAATEIVSCEKQAAALLAELPIPARAAARLLEAIRDLAAMGEGSPYAASQVLSHGDLHLGNYAKSGEKVVVLDWEHAHLNTIHWDLYHLLDMSHPLFPRQISPSTRTRVLNEYAAESAKNGKLLDRERLREEYAFFAAVYSVWMLLLIYKDLGQKEAVWPAEQLHAQWRETADSLVQCMSLLGLTDSGGGMDISNHIEKAVGE
ncbi:phosphotransferase [Paenibacillus sp. YPG26]|uniref:phosphotransferase n=1 Tax=Paenibacillus sp. YPG26 TaxID=2878915 RepID=UPI00203F86D3|nr:phosphotransferase [Paenibacillus sp. YPG26]USB33591.1 aminoglycoside phosphotransferase family protein [Paenibacillus sp. YPG26]